MKKHFTKLVFTFLTIVLLGQAGISQTYIWGGPGDPNSEFAGGLNDWTTFGDRDSAVWVWEADGKADRGAYFGTRGAIQSPSVSNGAAVFDSDYYDNNGTPGNFGNGVAPAPHTGYLVSPTFSCEGHESVWVQFNQYFRNFASITSIEVTIDGGDNWVSVGNINSSLSYNDVTKDDDVKLVNISNIANNQANVQFRFVFGPNPDDQRNYYFWVIDDVYVVDGPAGDPQITKTWYPPNRFNTPQSQITNDSMRFKMEVINKGGTEMTNIPAKVGILNEDLLPVYVDSLIFDIGVGDTLEINFKSFMPPADLDTGLYVAVYQIFTENTFTDKNKQIVHYFHVAPSIFDHWDGEHKIYNTSYSFSDGEISGATNYQGSDDNPSSKVYNLNYYKMADWTENGAVEVRAVEATVKASLASRPDVVPNMPINIYLFEIADTIDNYLNNFRGNDGIIVDGKESDQLTYVGYASENYENYDALSLLNVPFSDTLEEYDYVVLHPNKKYLLACFWSDEGEYYIQAWDDYYNGTPRYTYGSQFLSFLYTDYKDGGHYAVIDKKYKWVLGMNLQIFVSTTLTDEELLPDNTVTLLQNPVDNDLNVNVDFENTIDKATMIVHNINGDIIDMRTVKNIQKDSYKFYTGNLPAGTYIFTIFTKDKLLSKKFVVQH